MRNVHHEPMVIEFDGEIWFWRGPAPFYFVSVPDEAAGDLKAILSTVTYGWGMIPVRVEIGRTRYATAMWPKNGGYIVPIKAAVRKAEAIDEGHVIHLRLEVG